MTLLFWRAGSSRVATTSVGFVCLPPQPINLSPGTNYPSYDEETKAYVVTGVNADRRPPCAQKHGTFRRSISRWQGSCTQATSETGREACGVFGAVLQLTSTPRVGFVQSSS